MKGRCEEAVGFEKSVSPYLLMGIWLLRSDRYLKAMPPLEIGGTLDSQSIAIHKLIFISKYRDNSILRDEVVGN